MNSSFDFNYSSIKLAFKQNQVAIHQALPRINSNENIVQCCPSKKMITGQRAPQNYTDSTVVDIIIIIIITITIYICARIW